MGKDTGGVLTPLPPLGGVLSRFIAAPLGACAIFRAPLRTGIPTKLIFWSKREPRDLPEEKKGKKQPWYQALVEVVVCAVGRVVILPLAEMTAQSTALPALVIFNEETTRIDTKAQTSLYRSETELTEWERACFREKSCICDITVLLFLEIKWLSSKACIRWICGHFIPGLVKMNVEQIFSFSFDGHIFHSGERTGGIKDSAA